MTTFFTADHHMGHANILKLCNRPFSDVNEMNAALIANWNAVVGPDDEVWHLGDFAFRNARAADEFLRSLNGLKHLVHGNHDSEQTRRSPEWSSSQPYAEINVDGCLIVLCHYAFRTWRNCGRGSINLGSYWVSGC